MYELVDVKEKVWVSHFSPLVSQVYFVYKVKKTNSTFGRTKWIEESEYKKMIELGLIRNV